MKPGGTTSTVHHHHRVRTNGAVIRKRVVVLYVFVVLLLAIGFIRQSALNAGMILTSAWKGFVSTTSEPAKTNTTKATTYKVDHGESRGSNNRTNETSFGRETSHNETLFQNKTSLYNETLLFNETFNDTARKSAAARAHESPRQQQRQVSPTSSGGCELWKPQAQRQQRRNGSLPVWIPGYPGSGSELVKRVVAAMTGLEGAELYLGTCTKWVRAATCKTHWPVFFRRRDDPVKLRDMFDSSVILLLRNPAEAIPSFVNHIHEEKNNLALHSAQAPEEVWIWYRDNRLDQMLRDWKNVILAWHATTPRHYNVSTYLSYDSLVDETKGPDVLESLSTELRRIGVVDAGADDDKAQKRDDFECLWRSVVQMGKSSVKRANHTYVAGYTTSQKESMLRELDDLAGKMASREALLDILGTYKHDIRANLRIQQAPENTS